MHSSKQAMALGTYQYITMLLRIFLALPVTAATGERSFIAPKYLKNYLRWDPPWVK